MFCKYCGSKDVSETVKTEYVFKFRRHKILSEKLHYYAYRAGLTRTRLGFIRTVIPRKLFDTVEDLVSCDYRLYKGVTKCNNCYRYYHSTTEDVKHNKRAEEKLPFSKSWRG